MVSLTSKQFSSSKRRAIAIITSDHSFRNAGMVPGPCARGVQFRLGQLVDVIINLIVSGPGFCSDDSWLRCKVRLALFCTKSHSTTRNSQTQTHSRSAFWWQTGEQSTFMCEDQCCQTIIGFICCPSRGCVCKHLFDVIVQSCRISLFDVLRKKPYNVWPWLNKNQSRQCKK